jgi:signal transduction histidine kinase
MASAEPDPSDRSLRTGPEGLFAWRTDLLVWLPIAVITALHYGTSHELEWVHDVLRRLYYLPIVLAAFRHGLRGGLAAALVTSLVYLPHAFAPGHHHHDPAGGLEKALEILLYNSVGATAGWLAELERRRRRELQVALAEQRRLVDQLVAAGRLSALGEVVAGIAHEIKNPLHALAGTAEIVDPLIPADTEERRMWEIHRKELARLARVADRFLSFARPSPSDLVPLDLRRVAEQLALLTEAEARQKHIRLALELPPRPVTARGDADQLASLALHIAVNAFKKAPPSGGTLRIAVATAEDAALLILENDGPPLQGDHARLFEPFYSGDHASTGLGLSIAARIADQHGGTITAENAGLGVRFTLRLPILREP